MLEQVHRTCLVPQTVTCLAYNAGDLGSWVGKILQRRRWQPTPVLLPGKSHGQRSMVGYSPWGHKESDTTEQLHLYTNTISFYIIGTWASVDFGICQGIGGLESVSPWTLRNNDKLALDCQLLSHMLTLKIRENIVGVICPLKSHSKLCLLRESTLRGQVVLATRTSIC